MTTRGDQPPTDPRRWLDEHGDEIDETDRGLVYDLRTLVDRRRVLGLFGGFSAAALLAACGGGSGGSGQGSTATTAASGATTTTAGSVSSGGDLGEMAIRTALPHRLLTRKRSQVQTLSRPPHPC